MRIAALSYLPIDKGKPRHYKVSNGKVLEVKEGEFPHHWFDNPDHALNSFENYCNPQNNDQVQTDGAISPSLFNEDNDNDDNLPFSRNFDDDINEWILKMIS